MLKLRLLTAALLIPLVVWGVLNLPRPQLAACLAVIAMAGAWEWSRLAGCRRVASRIVSGLALLGILAGFWQIMPEPGWQQAYLSASLLLWLCALYLVRRYQLDRRVLLPAFVWMLAGLIMLAATWLALLMLHQHTPHGPALLIYLLALIWTADSGAYFVGRSLGRTKLATRVSPGKTLEGVAGGLISVLLLALAAAIGYFGYQGKALLLFVLLSLMTALISVLGDLFESMIKRQSGHKDSSHLLPGHGGVLDRIDSLMAAAPCFTLGMLWLERLS